MKSTRFYCRILMELEFSRQSFEKSSNTSIYIFFKIVSLGVDFFQADGPTDGQTDIQT